MEPEHDFFPKPNQGWPHTCGFKAWPCHKRVFVQIILRCVVSKQLFYCFQTVMFDIYKGAKPTGCCVVCESVTTHNSCVVLHNA